MHSNSAEALRFPWRWSAYPIKNTFPYSFFFNQVKKEDTIQVSPPQELYLYLLLISQSHHLRLIPFQSSGKSRSPTFPFPSASNKSRKLRSWPRLWNPAKTATPIQACSVQNCSLLQPAHKTHCYNVCTIPNTINTTETQTRAEN